MTKVLALQCKYYLILTCKFRTFPSSVAMMMLDAVPKGSTSLTTSLSDQPLSASPEISTRPSCRNDIRNLAGFDNSKNETAELFIKSKFTCAGAISLAPPGGKESKVKRKSRTTKKLHDIDNSTRSNIPHAFKLWGETRRVWCDVPLPASFSAACLLRGQNEEDNMRQGCQI